MKCRLPALLLTVCLIFSFTPAASISENTCLPEENDVSGIGTVHDSGNTEANSDAKDLRYIDNETLEKQGAIKRLPEKESLNSYAFLNRDGTESVVLFPDNIKYVDESGEIVEKDTAIVGNPSGGFTVKANDYGVLFPENIKDGLQFEYLECCISMIPDGAGGEHIIEDNSISYLNVFGENTILRYTPLLNGIKEDIVISGYSGINSFGFEIRSENLRFSDKATGRVLVNENGEPVIEFGDVIACDSKGKLSAGTLLIEEDAENSYHLTVSIPEEFLADPETVYPVTIDPTIYESSDGSYIQDSPVFDGASYQNSNFGTYLIDYAGAVSSYGNARTAMWLYGLEVNPIYKTLDTEELVSVNISVKGTTSGDPVYVNLYRISSNVSWNEGSVTYNNIGAFDTSVNCGACLSTTGRTEFDITSFAKGWKNLSYTNTMRVIFTASSGTSTWFYSSHPMNNSGNVDNRPYVIFTYQIKNLMEEGTYYIRNRHIDRFLQPVNGSSSANAGLELNAFSGSDSQKWEVISRGNGYYTIKNVNSGYVLSVPSGSYSTYDVQLIQASDTQADGQLWRIYMTSYCGFAIKPKSACGPNDGSGWSDRTMSVADGNDGNGALVTQRPYVYNNSFKDEWYLAPTNIPTSGNYSIINKQLGSYIQPEGTPESLNWSLALYSQSGLTAQKWLFESVGGGYYRISPYAHSDYYISVATGFETTENGLIVLQTYVSSNRQQWFIYKVPKGFVFKARSSGLNNLVLSVSEGNLGDGAVVSQRAYVNNLSYKEEWVGFTPSGAATNTSLTNNKTFFVRNKATGLLLTQNYPNANLSSYSGSFDQKWQFQNNNDGTVRLVSLSENTPTSGDYRYVLYSSSAFGLCVSPGNSSILPDLNQEWIVTGTSPNVTIKSKQFSTYLGGSVSSACLLVSETDYSRWELIECGNPYVLPSISDGAFSTEKYNSDGTEGLLHRMNCYAYAFGYFGEYAENVGYAEYDEVQPGYISANTFDVVDLITEFSYDSTKETYQLSPDGIDIWSSAIVYALNCDLQTLFDDTDNRVFQSSAEEVMTGPWKKIALVLDTTASIVIDNSYIRYVYGVDYHWYQEHRDGLWSHKLGLHEASVLDGSDLYIDDPQFCNRNDSSNYDYFVGYFKIKMDSVPDDVIAFQSIGEYDSAGDVSSMAYNIGLVHHGLNYVYDTRHAKIEYMADSSNFCAEDYQGNLPVVDTFEWPADSDWFEFMVETSGTYAIFSGGNGIDTYGVLLQNDEIIAEDDDSGNGFNFYMSVSLEAGQLYKICIAPFSATDDSFEYWICFD